MQKVDPLTILQLEWLESVKRNQYLKSTNEHSQNSQSRSQKPWFQVSSTYITVDSEFEKLD